MAYRVEILIVILILASLLIKKSKGTVLNTDENAAKVFLQEYNEQYSNLMNNYTLAEWNYTTNLTDSNADVVAATSSKLSQYQNAARAKAVLFDTANFSEDIKRQLKRVGKKTLDISEMEELDRLISEMGRFYGSFQPCRAVSPSGKQQCLSLEPDLTEIMANSLDPKEREWAWKEWHNGIGRQLRSKYIRFVQLKHKQALLNGFSDYGDQLRQKYETKELEKIVQNLYTEIEPLYKQLHAYVRRKLYETYGSEHVNLNKSLPAHLLGDMWGRFWRNLNTIVQPYPKKPSVDPTPQMIAQNYTVRRLFEMGEDFFKSMGLKQLPSSFYNLSLLEKPNDRKLICHATAWDFYDGQDFRIRMCTKVTFQDFLTVHHELGHVQYFMQYAQQPAIFRDGANDGFHEAVGELMAMMVANVKHLESVGLLKVVEDDDPELEINFLLQQALNTVSTLPFHLVQDAWLWKIFADKTKNYDSWNMEYWKLKEQIVGVHAPVPRVSTKDLDPLAIYHLVSDYEMIRYFLRTIIQYQFAQALCNASGHEGALHKCNIYNSTAAGSVLAKVLEVGASKPWQDVMEQLTGQRAVSVTPMLDYFEPLRVWLEKKNAENNEFIGWELSSGTPRCFLINYLHFMFLVLIPLVAHFILFKL